MKAYRYNLHKILILIGKIMVKQASYGNNWHNLVEMFFDQAELYHNKPFLHQRSTDGWSTVSWGEAAQMVENIALALQKIGVRPGDRVIILSENRYEWGLIDIAIMAIGAVMVPAYITNTTTDHQHIIEDSGASVAFISNKNYFKKFLPAALDAQRMHTIVTLEDMELTQNPGIELFTINNLCNIGQEQPNDIRIEAKRIEASTLACLIYTSGTGGAPKGVMLTHEAILQNCADITFFFTLVKKLSFFSILPLSHAFEHIALFAAITYHTEIYYPNGIENLLPGLQEAKPGILTAVPRIFEMFKMRIESQMKSASKSKKIMFQQALNLGLKKVRKEKLSISEKIQYFFLKFFVQKKIQRSFGNVDLFVSGGAPLDPYICEWLMAMGFPIIQGYGQTEAAPIIAANYPTHPKPHTVGPKLDSIEVKLGENNELLVRGRNVMKGYWNNRRATAETIKDGWLHTGDLAEFDDNGDIIITGRQKDIIVLSGGDNISPARLESLLTLEDEIGQAVIYGDKKNYLIAMLVPNEDWLKAWTKNNGKLGKLSDIYSDKELKLALFAAVKRVNNKTPVVENIRKIIISPEKFTIENGLLTPTLKVRRHLIIQKYQKMFDETY